MKKIVLYSPAVRNDGQFVDAGATLEIGDGADQIAADRVSELVDGGRAVSVTAAAADERAGRDPLDHDGDGRKGGSLPRATAE